MRERNPTRRVRIGNVQVGDGHPIVVQSMCATHTQHVEATAAQAEALREAGAGIVRIAVDSRKDVDALAEIRQRTSANLAVDLQESYRLAESVAPHVDKIRYNPGHLWHHETSRPVADKVRYLAGVAGEHDCAMRIGVNCGSLDPAHQDRFHDDPVGAMVTSAAEHCEMLDSFGFTRYVVSLKDSDPANVIEGNRRFAAERPDVPLHLGVTEAGMPPEGIIKTRIAFEQLVSRGIGDTVRVSLTLSNVRKPEEVEAGHQILTDISNGRFRLRSRVPEGQAEHHLLPLLLARREREVHRPGRGCPGDHPLRGEPRDHHRGHGLPGERPGRDGRRRPRALVRPGVREPEEGPGVARRLLPTTRSSAS